MLGAYQPSPNMIDAVQGSIEALTAAYYPVFATVQDKSRGDPNIRFARVERAWLEQNLQPLVDMFVVDWNRKNPSKGHMPRIKTIITTDKGDDSGAYSPHGHSITIRTNSESIVAAPYLYSAIFSTDNVLYAARNNAAGVVGLIFHEFLHATQSMLYVPETVDVYGVTEESLRYAGPTYLTKKFEIASYALTYLLPAAVLTPRRIYRDEDLKRILSFAIATATDCKIALPTMWYLAAHRVGVDFDTIFENCRFKSVFSAIPHSEEDGLMEIYVESLSAEKIANPKAGQLTHMRRQIIKDRGSFLARDELKRPRDNRVSRPLFEQFKRNFEPYMQLQLRNIRRRIHNFQSINEHFGLSNKAMYKPDYYALKF